MTPLQSQES
jgi:hypothetical protein